MQPLNHTRPTELSAALMENELLRYEVRHLKARLSAATGEFPPTPDDVTPGGRPEKPVRDRPETPTTAARETQAYDDIVWLLGRLDASVVGPVLRRWGGFRTLRERYLGGTGK